MGHYHDHLERRFDHLGGLLAYPGSIDLTPSEGIKETKKGFIIADLSGNQALTHWIALEQSRPQFADRLNYDEISIELARIIERAKAAAAANGKKPVARVEVLGKEIDSKRIALNLVKLNDHCIHYVWHPVDQGGQPAARAYDSMPAAMDAELYRLASEALGSEELARFAVEEILPLAASNEAKGALDVAWDAYKSKRFARSK
jgi:hypothetical protein